MSFWDENLHKHRFGVSCKSDRLLSKAKKHIDQWASQVTEDNMEEAGKGGGKRKDSFASTITSIRMSRISYLGDFRSGHCRDKVFISQRIGVTVAQKTEVSVGTLGR